MSGPSAAQVAPTDSHDGDGRERDRRRSEDREVADVDAVADRVVTRVVVEGERYFSQAIASTSGAKPLIRKPSTRERRRAAGRNRPAAGRRRRAPARARRSPTRRTRGAATARRGAPSATPPPPIATPATSPTNVPSATIATLTRDRRGLGQDQPPALDRMRQRQPEDPVLLLAGRRPGGAGDRRGRDHERPVDRADLAAHPAGDRAVVGAAQQLGDALRAGPACRSSRPTAGNSAPTIRITSAMPSAVRPS